MINNSNFFLSYDHLDIKFKKKRKVEIIMIDKILKNNSTKANAASVVWMTSLTLFSFYYFSFLLKTLYFPFILYNASLDNCIIIFFCLINVEKYLFSINNHKKIIEKAVQWYDIMRKKNLWNVINYTFFCSLKASACPDPVLMDDDKKKWGWEENYFSCTLDPRV